ncbi:MAG: polyamine aminopropyltransferase [Chloroflexota bacterium]|nr:polyamine aminopropyltransferase [Chloroflexota bacterium]
MNKNDWFIDRITPDMVQEYRIEKVLYTGKSQYQDVAFMEIAGLGRCLILDGKIQSSELDEFIYHESLVHPAMLTHPDPKTVLVAGGGEGATIREVLVHSSVDRVVMIDLDGKVVDLCRRYLTSYHQGSFDDSRLELLHDDAWKYIEQTSEKFDVIVLDLPEPIEAGPAYMLSTVEFYEMVKSRLTEGGTVSLQSGASAWGNHLCFTAIINTLKQVFPVVRPYDAFIPSYGGNWGFAFASCDVEPVAALDVDNRIAARITKPLRSYDSIAHQRLFALPKHLRKAIAAAATIITVDKPYLIYTPED